MRRFILPNCVFSTLLVVTSFSVAQSTSALINEALDKPVNLDLNGPLPRVLEQVQKETAVPIRVGPGVLDLLPWGEQTTVGAKVQNQTLRETLGAISRKLGLVVVVKDDVVEMQPASALKRLGRRATPQELTALDLLASTPLTADPQGTTVLALLGIIDARLATIGNTYAIENRAFGPQQDVPVFCPRNATLDVALESIVKDTNATWFPSGRGIVIVNKQDMVRAQLGRTISVRYNGVDLSQVLLELSQRAGVEFTIEPGAVQRVAPEFRSVRLILDNVSVQQALETLSGFTGIGYAVNERGVYLWNPTQNATPSTLPVPVDPLVGLINLDGGVQVMLRESQVPAALREQIRQQTARKIDEMAKGGERK